MDMSEESRKRMIAGCKKAGDIIAKRKLEREKKYNESAKKCLRAECENLILYDKRNNKFCTKSCSATHNNKKRDSRKPCLNCENLTNNYKFCTKKCETKHKREQRHRQIEKTGIATGVSAKPYLIETRGHRCEICGIEKWRGLSVPLVRDHINGNADDNSVKNQRLICHNCDAQLPTFAGRNYGNGRAERRKVYQRLGYC